MRKEEPCSQCLPTPLPWTQGPIKVWGFGPPATGGIWWGFDEWGLGPRVPWATMLSPLEAHQTVVWFFSLTWLWI